jgi:hypothetical protein
MNRKKTMKNPDACSTEAAAEPLPDRRALPPSFCDGMIESAMMGPCDPWTTSPKHRFD